MEINRFFADNIIKKIKTFIEEADGNEIYLVAEITSGTGLINKVNLLARGNSHMVPAILIDLKPGQVVIHNHPSGDLTPSGADIRLASRMGNNGIGFAIINNQVTDIYIVVEAKLPVEESPLQPEEIKDIFAPRGPLSQSLANYEYREQQIKVLNQVINSFNQHQVSYIEAGTGTGKSFAYLIPALYWSQQNDRTVVISTNTINLQEQLIEKDLVLLKRLLPFNFKAVLVKGRSNYVCKRKVENFKRQARESLSGDPAKEIEFIKILNWLEETKTGSRSDLNVVIKSDLWDEISSESDLCLKTNCPYFDSCYFMQARKEVYSSDLLIVNHHLLLSDAVLKAEFAEREGGILPKYKHLIIDEAHNFIDTATYHLGRPFYHRSLYKYIQRLYKNSYSLIPELRNRLGGLKIKNKQDLLEIIDKYIIPQVQRIQDKGSEYFTILKDFFSSESEDVLRLTGDILDSARWLTVTETGDQLAGQLNNLGIWLNRLYEEVIVLEADLLPDYEEQIMELEAAINKCQSLARDLDLNLSANDESYVFWLERETGFEGIQISQRNAPLDIADLLPDILWDRLENLILTSATLTVNNSFAFYMDGLGLKTGSSLQVESPFDYSQQASLIIPEDIPPANDPQFLEKVIGGLTELLLASGGSLMVLFTSYRMLNYCVRKTEKKLNQAGINLLPQGRYPRHHIINTFKENNSQIIFGTVSFWEGVDIKGEDLKYVVMMKLPFPVPSEPVAAAKSEKLEQEGLNPFYKYSLPRAVIRFKQGFGRLIRSRQDRGLVITLDNRLLTKSYGRVFLNSIPEACPVKVVKMESLRDYVVDNR